MTIATTFELPADVARAAALALERKAVELVTLDLRGISSATDFFLMGSGSSDIQVRSIADHIIGELKKEGVRPGHVEGITGGRWVPNRLYRLRCARFPPGGSGILSTRVLVGRCTTPGPGGRPVR